MSVRLVKQVVVGFLFFLLLTTPAVGTPPCLWYVISPEGGDPTITVAASDTDPVAWSRADFLCDGVRDQVEIQAAIDLLPVAGGTVRLLAGNYLVSQNASTGYCVRINQSNVRLELDAGAVVKLADNQYNGITGHVIQIGDGTATLRSNISIVGPGTIDGNETNNTGGAQPQNNACIHCTGDFQCMILGHGLTLTESCGVGLNLSGLTVDGSTNIRLVDLSITNGDDDGILAYGIDGMFIDNLLIDTMAAQDGWEPLQVRNLLMQNSIIRNTFGSAADIVNSDVETSAVRNENHHYVNCMFGPITTAASVIAIGVGGQNIHKSILFENCTIIMTDARRGFRIGSSGTSIPREIELRGVVVDGAGSSTGNSWGIRIGERAERTIVRNCTVRNCSTDGIYVEGASGTEAKETLIAGCSVYNNGTNQAGSGIRVGANVGRTTIIGNECFDNQDTPTQDYGIVLSGGAADVCVEGNTFWGNVIDDILGGAPDPIDLLLCFGSPAVPGCEAEDVNGDGTVNALDLIDLLLAFGTACPPLKDQEH